MRTITRTRVKRDLNIIFHVSEDEKNKIVELAQAQDMTISDYCRKTLFQEELNKDV